MFIVRTLLLLSIVITNICFGSGTKIIIEKDILINEVNLQTISKIADIEKIILLNTYELSKNRYCELFDKIIKSSNSSLYSLKLKYFNGINPMSQKIEELQNININFQNQINRTCSHGGNLTSKEHDLILKAVKQYRLFHLEVFRIHNKSTMISFRN